MKISALEREHQDETSRCDVTARAAAGGTILASLERCSKRISGFSTGRACCASQRRGPERGSTTRSNVPCVPKWPLFPRLTLVPLLLVTLAALCISCSRSEAPKAPAGPAKTRSVRVATAQTRPMERIVTVTGSLAADEAATLSVKVSGRLKQIPVDLGSVVKKGDVIAQVEPRDYELRLQQAGAALAQARAVVGLSLEGNDDVFEPEKTTAVKQAKALFEEASQNRERIKSLSKEGIAPKAELDTVESAYKVAQNRYEGALEETRNRQAILAQRRAEHELAKQQVSDTSLRAPFDGSVQTRVANMGEFVSAGSPVVKLVKTDPLRLRLEVPERDALAVRSNQAVRVHVEGDTNIHHGVISRVSPAIDEVSRMLLVEADVRNNGVLRPGLLTRSEVVTRENDPGISVPADAIITFAGLEKVIGIKEGKAHEKIVTTGRRGAGWVEIVSGLAAGEQVVIQPGNLRTGEPVTILDSTSAENPRMAQTGLATGAVTKATE